METEGESVLKKIKNLILKKNLKSEKQKWKKWKTLELGLLYKLKK